MIRPYRPTVSIFTKRSQPVTMWY